MGKIKRSRRAVATIQIVATILRFLKKNERKGFDKKKVFKDLKVHFPADESMGVHLNVSGAGVMKNAPNVYSAVKFIEFLASDEAQKIYSYINFEYPVVDSIGIPETPEWPT